MTPALLMVLVAGAIVGLGLVVAVGALRLGPAPLHPALERALGDGVTSSRQRGPISWSERTVADLAVVGRTPESQLSRVVGCTIGGVLAGPTVLALCAVAGAPLPVQVSMGASLALAAAGAVAPGLVLRSEAAERRAEFRVAFSAFLDLVALCLAGGQGVESAMESAATSGSGWGFAEIDQALYRSKRAGGTVWDGLDALTTSLGVPQPAELAAAARLSERSGSAMRTSLAARARSLRAQGAAEELDAAESATERMAIPQGLLTAGFLILVGYPALARILGT